MEEKEKYELKNIDNEDENIVLSIERNLDSFHDVSHPQKKMFLAAYGEVGTVTRAAQIAGVVRETHYRWLDNDKNYPEQFARAERQAHEKIEAEIKRRAIDGVLKPVFYQGAIVGHVKEYSDNLLMFYAKGAMPEKYKERVSNEINLVHQDKSGINTLKQLKESNDNIEDI